MTKDTLLQDLDILSDCDLKRLLLARNVKTLGELATLTLEEMYYTDDQVRLILFRDIRRLGRVLHSIGLTYKDEYVGTNIPDDLIDRDVYCLHIPFTIQKGLKHSIDVQTVGELVTTPKEEILKARGVAEVSFNKLRLYLSENELRFKFPGELKIQIEKKRELPVPIIKKVQPDIVPEPMQLPKRTEMQLEVDIQTVVDENQAIAERIARKERLIAQYQQLLDEQAELRLKEQEVDIALRALNEEIKVKVK